MNPLSCPLVCLVALIQTTKGLFAAASFLFVCVFTKVLTWLNPSSVPRVLQGKVKIAEVKLV